MSIDTTKLYIEEYLDWLNNYLTVEKYAEHNGITVAEAELIISIGRYNLTNKKGQ